MGHRQTTCQRLKAIGVNNAFDFIQLRMRVQKHEVVGLRLKHDLMGISIDFEDVKPKQNIACT